MECKTGCGQPVEVGHLCGTCDSTWSDSKECQRGMTTTVKGGYMRALVDFCARVRAENQNRVP